MVALRVWQRGTFYCQPKYIDGGIWGLSLTCCPQIRFWYWALPMCPWKPSVAGCSASSVFHLLNNFTLASSIFATFSTRYNLQTNSSASWILRDVRSPSPMCWSSLFSLTNTPHGFHGVHCSTGALGIFSCLKSPTPGTTIILSSSAWAISYLESRSESFCLLQGTAGKSFQFCGSDTFLS